MESKAKYFTSSKKLQNLTLEGPSITFLMSFFSKFQTLYTVRIQMSILMKLWWYSLISIRQNYNFDMSAMKLFVDF